MTVGISPRAPPGGEKPSKVVNRQRQKMGGYDSHPTKVREEARFQSSRGETGGEAEAGQRRDGRRSTRRNKRRARRRGKARRQGMCQGSLPTMQESAPPAYMHMPQSIAKIIEHVQDNPPPTQLQMPI